MRNLFITIVCGSAVLCAAATPWTALSQDAKPAAAGDTFLTIPACDFTETSDDLDFSRMDTISFTTGNGAFYGPVYLPHGSTIKKIMLICIDDSNSDNIDLYLNRVTTSGVVELIVEAHSTGRDVNMRTFPKRTTSKRWVNTRKFYYFLKLWLPGTGVNGYHFSQAKIVYAPPSP